MLMKKMMKNRKVQYVDEADDSVYTFTGHTGEVYTAMCSPTDASLVATGGEDDRGFKWKIGQGDSWFRGPLNDQYHEDSVSSLAFSPDGQLLASGSVDGHIRVWDTTSGSLKGKLEGPGGEIEVRWHPRRHMVLAGSKDSAVLMWSVDGIRVLSGKFICTGYDDATLMKWDSVWPMYPCCKRPALGGLTCLTISSDSALGLAGSMDSPAHIVNITTGKVVTSLSKHEEPIQCAGFSVSGPWAATGGMDNKLIIWDLHQSSPLSTCEHEDGVLCLLWVGKSSYVATGCVDGKVRLWDSHSGECVRTFRGQTRVIQFLSQWCGASEAVTPGQLEGAEVLYLHRLMGSTSFLPLVIEHHAFLVYQSLTKNNLVLSAV
ncbi:hypothetical protein K7X08_003962 [Anisodus acutangulus]|uniref:Uncharacterized protein n=1 Tax=Anisodus acutangulus TaxID=402998 RepID=A0A9Q1RJN4_9SOLA|nr:hypothetical protein K7X08_003962 [Anisodus acutangulus]